MSELSWYQDILNNTRLLVSHSSVSPNIETENRCAKLIADMLVNSQDGTICGLCPQVWYLKDGRQSIACLLKGEGKNNSGDTLILLGHFDTVGYDEFSVLTTEADSSIALSDNMVCQSIKKNINDLLSIDQTLRDDIEASWRHEDFQDSVWMFGRGSLDMKSGISMQISIMRRLWTEKTDLHGNILFLACPDEENESMGVLSSLEYLQELSRREEIRYVGIINCDYTSPRDEAPTQWQIYNGTVGKLLPGYFIQGQQTHLAEPTRGVDASLIASMIHAEISLENNNITVVPPALHRSRDIKMMHNAQTIRHHVIYFNWVTYRNHINETINYLKEKAIKAIQSIDMRIRMSIDNAYGQIKVVSFAELCEILSKVQGWSTAEAIQTWLDQKAQDLLEQLDYVSIQDQGISLGLHRRPDNLEFSRLMVETVLEATHIKKPIIVVFLAPPFYPSVGPQEGELTKSLSKLIDILDSGSGSPSYNSLLTKYALAIQTTCCPKIENLKLSHYYPYISDTSYISSNRGIDWYQLANNMPTLNRRYWLQLTSAGLDCPIINMGPWGKNAHSILERVHKPFSFEFMPELIYQTILELFVRPFTTCYVSDGLG